MTLIKRPGMSTGSNIGTGNGGSGNDHGVEAPSEDSVDALLQSSENYIRTMMRLAEQGDPMVAAVAASFEERTGLGIHKAGPIFFGIDSVGGAIVVDQWELLAKKAGYKVLGYKPIRTNEEAQNRKAATDYHLKLRAEHSAKVILPDQFGGLWSKAMLNPAEVLAAFPVNEHGNVRSHGAIITGYKGLGLGQMFPELNKLIDQDNPLAKQLRAATLEVIMERLGFWRSYRISDVEEPTDIKKHYTKIEVGFFRLANEIFGLGLKPRDFDSVRQYLTDVNDRLVIEQSDLGRRRDAKYDNYGYAVEKIALPTLDEVIAATTSTSGIITSNEVREHLVDYDLEGRKMLVPRYHDFSHIEIDRTTRFTEQEAQLYMAVLILAEKMYKAMKEGQKEQAIGVSGQIAALLAGRLTPDSDPELKAYNKKIARPNRPVTNLYRCLEEGEQTLQTRLPRFIVRMNAAETAQQLEAYTRMQEQVDTHIGKFWSYVERAKEWHAKVAADVLTAPGEGYRVLTSALERLLTEPRHPIPANKLVAQWDGF